MDKGDVMHMWALRRLQSLVVLLLFSLACVGCSGGDGGTNDNQSNNNNQTIPELCGDGKVDPGEECDNGGQNSDLAPDACRTNCRFAHCGDGVKDSGEVCDGLSLDGADCVSLGDFTGGELACATDCSFDTSNCTTCGNGVKEGDEQCDTTDFGGASCSSLGHGQGGTLACDSECQVDPSGCYSCGDGVKDGPEECDGEDFGTTTCMTLGFSYGKLGCNALTCTVDTAGCRAVCGNGVIEGAEECEVGDLHGATCVSAGFAGGQLRCTSGCRLSYANCTTCGDGTRDAHEECDGSDLNSLTCATLSSNLLTGNLACTSGCRFDTSGCSGAPVSCGNGVKEGDEQCDNWDLGGADCASRFPALYGGGTLVCTASCVFDTQFCTALQTSFCGDGTVDPDRGEQCDGADLSSETCATLGYPGGTLSCKSTCDFDVSGCHAPTSCGNGVAEPENGEACDGADLGTFTTCAALGYASGTLACAANCSLNTSGCSTCGDGTRNGLEECDGADLGGNSCQSLGFSSGALGCTTGCIFDDSACRTCVPEQCNGLDDDCDGAVDNGFQCALGAVDTTCIVPGCGYGQRTCGTGCIWSACTIPEICNGLDDNCNGQTDEGFDCALGTTRSCTNACGTGTEQCIAGCTWSGQCTIPEICNGLDDNCNGQIDEGFECARYSTEGCLTSCNSFGSKFCGSNCTWAPCMPPAETCNGQDDDCDGIVDNDVYQVTSSHAMLTPDTYAGWIAHYYTGTELAIVWVDIRNGYEQLFFNRFDATGQRIGTDTPLTFVNASVSLRYLDITRHGTGWAVTWSESGNPWTAYLARIDSSGAVVLPRTRILSSMNPNAGVQIAWEGGAFGMAAFDANDGFAYFVLTTDNGAPLIPPIDLYPGRNTWPGDMLWNGTNFALTLYGGANTFELRDSIGTLANRQTTVASYKKLHLYNNVHLASNYHESYHYSFYDMDGNLIKDVHTGGSGGDWNHGVGCKPDLEECVYFGNSALRRHLSDNRMAQLWSGHSWKPLGSFWTGSHYLILGGDCKEGCWSGYENLRFFNIGCP